MSGLVGTAAVRIRTSLFLLVTLLGCRFALFLIGFLGVLLGVLLSILLLILVLGFLRGLLHSLLHCLLRRLLLGLLLAQQLVQLHEVVGSYLFVPIVFVTVVSFKEVLVIF